MRAIGLTTVLLLFLCVPAIAQEPAQSCLLVTVEDASGARVVGATIRIETLSHEVVASSVSDSIGSASLYLSPGNYELFAVTSGFKTYKQTIQLRDQACEPLKVALMIDPIIDIETFIVKFSLQPDPAIVEGTIASIPLDRLDPLPVKILKTNEKR